MRNYNWDKEKLEKLKERLKIESLEGNQLAFTDLNTLELMLGKENSDGLEKENLYNPKMVPIIQKIAKEFCEKSLIKRMPIDSLLSCDLDIDEFLLLIHDFYKGHSPLFYENFLKEYNKRKTNLQVKYGFGSFGITYHLLFEQESYIEIMFNNTILDISNLPHEYGHAITFLIRPDFVTNLDFLFIRELDGYYFQTKFFDYLIENTDFKEEAVFAKTLVDYDMYRRARSLSENEFDLKRAISFYSYVISVGLCTYDTLVSDDLLEEIITGNPEEIFKGKESINPEQDLEKNIQAYQKTIKTQLGEYVR